MEILSNFEEYKDFIPVDNDEFRMSIPSTSDLKIKPAVIWQILKDLIGKDLSTFSLPVFLNEPINVL